MHFPIKETLEQAIDEGMGIKLWLENLGKYLIEKLCAGITRQDNHGLDMIYSAGKLLALSKGTNEEAFDVPEIIRASQALIVMGLFEKGRRNGIIDYEFVDPLDFDSVEIFTPFYEDKMDLPFKRLKISPLASTMH